ncbi:MAG: hypothetical protein ABI304_01955 [Rudaea sp.]
MAGIPLSYSQSFMVDAPGITQSRDREPFKVTIVSSQDATSDNMTNEIFINDLAGRVGRVESDVSKVREDISAIKTKVDHVPTRAELYLAAIGILVGVLAILWQFMAGPLAAKLVEALAKAPH